MAENKKEKISIYAQLSEYLLKNKKWWLTPALVVILALVIIILYLLKYQETVFIYSLF